MRAARQRLIPHVAVLAVLAAVFCVTLWLRSDGLADPILGPVQGARAFNGDVVEHFADVLQGYRTSPASTHLLAPLQSPDDAEIALGRGLARERPVARLLEDVPHLPWLINGDGRLLYVSFPPGGFAMAAAALAAVGAEPGPRQLLLLSLALQPVCAALLYALIWMTFFRGVGGGAWRQALCAAAASAYLLGVQPLHDHGATIWAHHLMQPLILASLLLVVSSTADRRAAPRALALGILAFFGATTEWTGHLLNASIFAASLWLSWRDAASRRGHLAAAAAVALGEAAALGALAALYGQHVGLASWLEVLPRRATVRGLSGEEGAFAGYVVSLMQGIGPHLAAAAALWILVALVRRRTAAPDLPCDPARDRGRAAVACLAFACSENLFLMEHATLYPFDLLKVTLLVACLVGAASAWLLRADGRAAVSPVLVVVALASVGSLVQHRAIYGAATVAAAGPGLVCARAPLETAADALPFNEGEILMVGSATSEIYRIYPGPAWGRRAAPVADLAEAATLLERTGAAVARVAVVGGGDFDRSGDAFRLGRISAEVTIRREGGATAFRLLPARGDTPIASKGGDLRFHSSAAVRLVATGAVVTSEAGARFLVTAVDHARRAVSIRKLDGGEITEAPHAISWEASMTDSQRRVQLAQGHGDDDMSCGRGDMGASGDGWRR